MDVFAVTEVVLMAITVASIIFYGGRIVQKVDDFGTALNALVKRFDATVPEMDKRLTKVETLLNK